jgi:S1-C subfamily serine protease
MSEEWRNDPRFDGGSKKKTIHLFGVEYGEDAYINKFLSYVYDHFERNYKHTEMGKTKLELKAATGSQWDSSCVHPSSKNAFIHKYFDYDDAVGLEGIWEQENWGLIGFVKSGKDYLKYNIKINGFNSRKPHPMFHTSSGYDTQDVENDFNVWGQHFASSKLDGTRDGILFHTKDKKKFKFEGRKTYLAKIDSLVAPINVDMKMSVSLLGDDHMEMRPPYGDSSIILKRVWPHEAVSMNKKKNVAAGSGTAFFVDDKGHIITNYHVVESSDDECKIMFNNKEYEAKIIAKDKKLDLALLKTSIKNKNFIKISNKSPVKLQRIIAAGYPHGKNLSDDLKFTSGIISALKGFDDDTAQIQIDAALNPGNSGGPIVDEKNGNLVAVAVAGYRDQVSEGINFGIKASQVNDFLDSNKINNKKVSLKSSSISSVLENSTVYIFFK